MQNKFTTLLVSFLTIISLSLTAQDVVIQEVLYNPTPGITQKIALRNVSGYSFL